MICPFSDTKLDENVVRLNAFITFVISLVCFIIPYSVLIPLFLGFLGIDFMIKGFINIKYSILGWLCKKVVRLLKISPSLIDAAPKIYAAKLGLIFCLISMSLYFLKLFTFSMIVLGCLTFCSFLEAFFNICLGCKIYSLLMKIKLIFGK